MALEVRSLPSDLLKFSAGAVLAEFPMPCGPGFVSSDADDRRRCAAVKLLHNIPEPRRDEGGLATLKEALRCAGAAIGLVAVVRSVVAMVLVNEAFIATTGMVDTTREHTET